MQEPGTTRCGNTEFHWGKRTYIMGIINLSPESFSGDGIADTGMALEQAHRFTAEGADILDIGGESTRPGLPPISIEEELKRVMPLIEKLANTVSVPLSIDTCKYEVAVRALDAGVSMINDQWGLKREPRLAELAAERGVPLIMMSNQRDKGAYDPGIQRDTGYTQDIMTEVTTTMKNSLALAMKLGVLAENTILDPGIGFGKTWQQDLELMRNLSKLKELGRPLIIGPSRKSVIGMVLNLPANDRLEGTAAAVAISIAHGADMVRVHDVRQMARVCHMSDAIIRDTGK
jgi:dihydropteroate synthase